LLRRVLFGHSSDRLTLILSYQVSFSMYKKSIFIFRRDLRLYDNSAFCRAAELSESVLPCFFFDPRQYLDNPYASQFALWFMVRSLDELDNELRKIGGRLYYFSGEPQELLKDLIKDVGADAVFLNYDYTPFSRKRDKAIRDLCLEIGAQLHAFHDALLFAPGKVLKDDGSPYTVYTPFMKRASKQEVRQPATLPGQVKLIKRLKSTLDQTHPLQGLLTRPPDSAFRSGGRREAMDILSDITDFKNYAELRDIPAKAATTGLSAHLKFGTVSAREVYALIAKNLGKDHLLIRELFWRDFFTHIAYYFPNVFGEAFQERYRQIQWNDDQGVFSRWKEGKTGFPIVDAGMRELLSTGFMHNRVRMIVASFLVKDLHLDWRWGEQHFAQYLVDYDPAVNNGNWQWAASTGCDAQPYFRIFNPWLQQKKFDPEAEYIKRWIPELDQLSSSEIHKLSGSRPDRAISYPEPIVIHEEAREEAKALFAKFK